MVMRVNTEGLGEIAYKKYQEEWPELTPWKDLPEKIRDLWQVVAEEIVNVTLGLKEDSSVCQFCGKSFNPKRDGAKFCSPTCRVDFHTEKNKEIRRVYNSIKNPS